MPRPYNRGMPKFSTTSKSRLDTCHPLLIELFSEVILSVDCTILCGHRTESDQNLAVASGKSKTRWPGSKHNSTPSLAVDVAPYFPAPPHIIWPSLAAQGAEVYARTLGQWYLFIGYVRRTAEDMGIAIRTGADWDGDWQTTDQTFHDLPHFELLSTVKV
ncbi:hypothetical protein LJC47_00195 [Desulfosarcina sp. OttesenSCG-928-B08]|nr:hypothetical protein [Desulfosarcina sp. OttesenSCG-928-B08]